MLNAAAGESEAVRIFGTDYPTPDGTCIRDYIHVEDLAEAHIQALRAEPRLSGCYNVGTGCGHSVREVIDTVRKVTGRAVPEIIADRRPEDPPELVADSRKIQGENFAFSPSAKSLRREMSIARYSPKFTGRTSPEAQGS